MATETLSFYFKIRGGDWRITQKLASIKSTQHIRRKREKRRDPVLKRKKQRTKN